MKKKFKIANFNSFFYFERKLLEDYLNAQAKKGYHVKVKNYKHGFEYIPDKHVYYHVDAIKTKKRYAGQVKPDEQYLELFEEQGYHFIGKINLFNIFESSSSESIFGTEDEDDIVKDIFKREFKTLMPTFLLSLFFLALVILVTINGIVDPLYVFLSNSVSLFICAAFAHIIGEFYCTYLPIIKYKITKKLDYTYKHILKRQFIYQSFVFIYLLYMLSVIVNVNIRMLVLAIPLTIIFTIIILNCYEDLIVEKNNNFGIIYLAFIAIFVAIYNNYDNTYVLQHPQIKYKEYSQRSSLLEWSWYQLNDSEDMLYFIDVYEPLLTDYVFDSFIDSNEYIQDGDTYFVRDYVVVRKENRILKMEMDFYENHLSSLDW